MREKFEDYCEVISGYAFKSKDLLSEGDVPVIKIGNISNGSDVIVDEGTQYVIDEFLSIDNKYHVKKGDLLISLTGSHINQPNSMVGRTCRNYSDNEYLLNQRAGKIIPKINADIDYLYYLFSSKAIKESIVTRAYGAANQVNVSPTAIGNIKWEFPDVNIQRRIGEFLKLFDELIQNNNRRIKLLEQMAENIYKEWFVRFRFPGQKSFEWIVGKAEDFFDITIGKTPSRKDFDAFTVGNENAVDWISISDMKSMYISDTNEQLTQEAVKNYKVVLVPKDTILLSFKLTVGRVAITTKNSCTNEAIAHFKKVDDSYREYLYMYLKLFNYQELGNTSAIGNAINSKIVKAMDIRLPSKICAEQFSKITKPLFDEILNLNKKNENLTKQRDYLLPRLMSGKIKV